MDRVQLVVQQRDEVGSREVRRLRKLGQIPGVLYGSGKPATAIMVEATALRAAVTTPAGLHAVLDVTIEGQKTAHTAILKTIQHDKVKHHITHIDLQEIRLSDPIETSVVLHIEGTPQGVKMGGVLDVTSHEVEVRGLPTAIPEHLTLNVDHLDIGGHARLGEIELPEGITLVGDPEETVCTVVSSKVGLEEEEEAAEAAEAAAAEPEVIGKKADEEGAEA